MKYLIFEITQEIRIWMNFFSPLVKQEHPMRSEITSQILSPSTSFSSIWDSGEGGLGATTSLHPVGVASQSRPPTTTPIEPLLKIFELSFSISSVSKAFISLLSHVGYFQRKYIQHRNSQPVANSTEVLFSMTCFF